MTTKSRVAKRNRERAYRTEKAAEVLFKSRRVGTMGREDNFNLLFSIEAKDRQNPPKTIIKWIEQAEANCPEGRIPMVYLHKTNQRRERDWVIMRVKDFKAAFDKLLEDRKSTLLNSSHTVISYAVVCLKKKKKNHMLIRQDFNKCRNHGNPTHCIDGLCVNDSLSFNTYIH